MPRWHLRRSGAPNTQEVRGASCVWCGTPRLKSLEGGLVCPRDGYGDFGGVSRRKPRILPASNLKDFAKNVTAFSENSVPSP